VRLWEAGRPDALALYLALERRVVHFDDGHVPEGDKFKKLSKVSIFSFMDLAACITDIQGDSKFLDTFVLPIYSTSYGAQKTYYCQIKAEILKFM
jgi:hypothetical protein